MSSAAFPLGFIEPMQPTLVTDPPEGGAWIYEVNGDGYRAEIVLQEGTARDFTRHGNDWTSRFTHIAAEASQLPCTTAIIDGEIVLADQTGASDFSGLQKIIQKQSERLTFVAFDLMHLDGADLRQLPLSERRAKLEALIGSGTDRIQFSQSMPGTGAQIFAGVKKAGLEGIVAKRLESRYRSGRNRDWLKVKAFDEEEFELVAVRRETGKPPIALLARNGKYVGSTFIALPGGLREKLWRRVREKAEPAKASKDTATQWLQPGIVARVRFLQGEAKLRHASLKDWREE